MTAITDYVFEQRSWRGDLARASLLYLATRLALVLFVWLTGQHFTAFGPHGLDRSFFPENFLLNGLFQWDAYQYSQLIKHGYYQGAGYDVTTPYFPAFPLGAWLVGKLFESSLVGGIVLNHVASIGSAFLIAQTARTLEIGERAGDREAVARETTLFWLASPLSFFFCVFLSESLFGLVSVLVLWAVVKGRWPAALLAGIVVTATRNAGMIVAASAAVLAWERRKEVRVGPLGWTCIALMPLGLCALIVYQHYAVGDGFAWVKSQLLWNRFLTWPWTTVIDDWQGTPDLSPQHNVGGMYRYQELLALLLIAPLFFLRGRLNIPWALLLLGVAQWILPLTSHSIMSCARYQAGNLYFALAIPAFIAARSMTRGLVWMLLGMVMAWYASTFPYGIWAS
jgi:hypothetical protein